MGLVVLLAVGLVGAILVVAWWTAWWITHPPRRTFASALAKGRAGDPGALPRGPDGTPRAWGEDGVELHGFRAPVWDVTGNDPHGPIFIFSHGWGDSRVGGLSRCAALLPLASRVVMWDMPGHGMAPGTCSLGTREVRLLRALIAHVTQQHPASRVLLMGWSLGAGVSIAAMADWDDPIAACVGGVIAEAPYRQPWTPAANVLRMHGLPVRWNLPLVMAVLGLRFGVGRMWQRQGGFDRAAMAQRLRVPLLVLHGELDDVSPIEDGRAIAGTVPASAGGGTLVSFESSGHHGLWTTPATCSRCMQAVRELVDRIAPANTP